MGRPRKPRPQGVVLNSRGTEKKSENGRPKETIDIKLFESFVSFGATDIEMAGYFGISVDVLARIKNEPEFRRIYETTTCKRRMSLRRKQYELANQGNTAMLIWLGKTELKQSDRVTVIMKPPEEWTDEELDNAIRAQGGDPAAIAAEFEVIETRTIEAKEGAGLGKDRKAGSAAS